MTPSAIREGMTLAAVLATGVAGGSLDALDARVLAGFALHLTRVQLITQSERILDAPEAALIASLFERRIAGEPVAYLTGEREFFGLSFEVSPAVLIPRPDTELLVELALGFLPPRGRLLDMGTGSGAIPVACAHQRPDAVITALDVSDAALQVAQRNAARHAAKVRFLKSDWYAALAGEHFELITSNPPYIAAGDPHLSQGDLRHEPPDALTDHGDGLAALRKIIAGAPAHLLPGGWLLLEHGYDQAAAVRGLLAAQNMSDVQSWRDLAGIERVSGARIAPA